MNLGSLEVRIGKELLGWDYEDKVWFNNGEYVGHFYPASDLEDAFLVLYKICENNHWKSVIETGIRYNEVTFKTLSGTDTGLFGTAETLPEAICLVAIDVLDDESGY